LTGVEGGYVFNGKYEKSFANGTGTANSGRCAVVVIFEIEVVLHNPFSNLNGFALNTDTNEKVTTQAHVRLHLKSIASE